MVNLKRWSWVLALVALLAGGPCVMGQDPWREVVGQYEFQSLGHQVACLGDINGDGVADFAASGAGSLTSVDLDHIIAYSSADLSTLWVTTAPVDSFDFRRSMVSIGDVNGDGVIELAVSDPAFDSRGFVAVLSGVDGSILHGSQGRDRSDYGRVVSPLGDINRDGIPDYAVGRPWRSKYPWERRRVSRKR